MTKYKLVAVAKLLYKYNVKSENAQFQFGGGQARFSISWFVTLSLSLVLIFMCCKYKPFFTQLVMNRNPTVHNHEFCYLHR